MCAQEIKFPMRFHFQWTQHITVTLNTPVTHDPNPKATHMVSFSVDLAGTEGCLSTFNPGDTPVTLNTPSPL